MESKQVQNEVRKKSSLLPINEIIIIIKKAVYIYKPKDPAYSNEDLVQEVLLNVLSTYNKYTIQNFGGWVYSVSKNYCVRYLEEEKKLTSLKCIWETNEFLETDNGKWMEEESLNFWRIVENHLSPQEWCIISKHYREGLSAEYLKKQYGSWVFYNSRLRGLNRLRRNNFRFC